MSKCNVERILKSVKPDEDCELKYVRKLPSIKWSEEVITIDVDCMVSDLNVELLNAMSHVRITRVMIHNHDSYVFDFYDMTDTLIPPGLILDVMFSDKLLVTDDEGGKFLLELMSNNQRVVALPATIEKVFLCNNVVH